MWCERIRDRVFDTHIRTKSPGKARINGVNNKDFATTFNCKRGTYMNPIKNVGYGKIHTRYIVDFIEGRSLCLNEHTA